MVWIVSEATGVRLLRQSRLGMSTVGEKMRKNEQGGVAKERETRGKQVGEGSEWKILSWRDGGQPSDLVHPPSEDFYYGVCARAQEGSKRRPLELGPAEKTNGLGCVSPFFLLLCPIFIFFPPRWAFNQVWEANQSHGEAPEPSATSP